MALQSLAPKDQAKLLEVLSNDCPMQDHDRVALAAELFKRAKSILNKHRLVDKHIEQIAVEIIRK
ncbi:MAG: hypothetical protein U0905_16885 [Pirellulales bacterium]